MKLTYYARVAAGIKTHIYYLLKYFDAKLINQKTLNSLVFYNERICLDSLNSHKLIKKEMESCDIFHIHHIATTSELLLPIIYTKLKHKPILINTFHIPVGNTKHSLFSNTYLKFIAESYNKISNKFIVIGSKQKEIIKDVVDDKIVTIPNSVDIDKFKKRNSKRFFNDFTIGYLGRLDPEKNVLSLIKACKRAGVNLVIAGRGVQYNKIKKMENEKLKVFGFFEDKIKFYNSLDVFASTSYQEAGVPYTILEAMSCEKPVLTCNCGGEEENLKNCGIICKTKVKEIEKSINEIKNKDLQRIGRNARKVVIGKYNIKTQIRDLSRLYNSFLN